MSGKRKQNLVPVNLATFRQPKSLLSLKPKSCLERENKTLCLLTLPLIASENLLSLKLKKRYTRF